MSDLISFNVSPDNLETIQSMAACNFSASQIALQLGVKKQYFLKVWNDKESEVREAYDAGVLQTKLSIMGKQKELAEGGNITAAQIFLKEADKIEFENIKRKVFFGDEA